MQESVIMEGHARSENRLSFSDLLFSIDDLHLDENQNPNTSLDDDFLGFFNDANSKRRNAQAEGVVFCGKIIDISRTTQKPSKIESKKNNIITRSKSVRVLVGKKEGSNERASSCSSKSRFMFGSGRYPTKMELSELRSRQSKMTCSSGGKRMPVLIRVLGCVGGFEHDKCSTATYVNVSSY